MVGCPKVGHPVQAVTTGMLGSGRDVRVPAITIGTKFEEQPEGSVAIHSPFPGVPHGLRGGDDVHSVDLCGKQVRIGGKSGTSTLATYLKTWDLVAACVVLR
jgi:hypothetical protein